MDGENSPNENGDDGEASAGNTKGALHVSDTALCKRAASIREKLQDDTYSWIMKALDMIFENFPVDQDRTVPIDELHQVVEKYCAQDVEHKKAKHAFETVCKNHKEGRDPSDEYKKLLEKEGKVTNADVKKHPKYVKFMDRLQELDRAKQLSQTEAISVE